MSASSAPAKADVSAAGSKTYTQLSDGKTPFAQAFSGFVPQTHAEKQLIDLFKEASEELMMSLTDDQTGLLLGVLVGNLLQEVFDESRMLHFIGPVKQMSMRLILRTFIDYKRGKRRMQQLASAGKTGAEIEAAIRKEFAGK